MKRLEFDCQQLSERPYMISESSSHPRRSLHPLGSNQSRGRLILIRQRHPQTQMGPCEVVERLEEDDSPLQLAPLLTETPGLSDQRSERMAQGEVEPFNQTGTDREPQFLQSSGPAEHAGAQRFQASLLLLLDHLSVDQIRVGLLDRVPGASPLAGARKGLKGMVALDQRRQIATEAVTEKAGDAQHHGGGHLNEQQGTLKRPGAHHGGQEEAKLGSETDPDPLASILSGIATFAIGARLGRVLPLNEIPHLIELHLGDRQLSEQVRIDLLSLRRGSPEPLQDRGFRDAQDKADARQIHFDQDHLEGHHDLLFGGLQVKEDRLPRFGEGCLTDVAPKDASLPTLSQVRRDGANVPPVDELILRALGIRTRLTPVLGFSHGPILRSV